jgi:hypothetical protein
MMVHVRVCIVDIATFLVIKRLLKFCIKKRKMRRLARKKICSQ